MIHKNSSVRNVANLLRETERETHTESMCVQERDWKGKSEGKREREACDKGEGGGTSERARKRERERKERESEKQRAEVRVHGWILNAKERVRCVGVCVDVERGMSRQEGKLESRPTVTRLSLGCLILVRSLI